jgi:hypothetical protein
MRWNTSTLREAMIEKLPDDLRSDDARIRNAARKVVLEMEAQNQRDEHKVIDVRVQTRNDQLPGIAADLGIEVGLIEDAARKADSGAGADEGASG